MNQLLREEREELERRERSIERQRNGPFRCTLHDECRAKASIGAACWNEWVNGGPVVGK
jgi:hypothetical protein